MLITTLVTEQYSYRAGIVSDSIQTPLTAVRPLRSGLKGLRLNRASIEEAQLLILMRKREEQEQELYTTVEKCLNKIRQDINQFFENYYAKLDGCINSIIDNQLLFRHSKIGQLLPEQDVKAFEAKLKQEIQHKIHGLYGVTSIELLGNADNYQRSQEWDNLLACIAECRRTLLLAQGMEKAANKAWGEGLARFNFSPVLSKLINKVDLGTIYLGIVDCHAQKQTVLAQTELKGRLAGILNNIKLRLTQELCLTTARVFYGLYDDLYDRPVADKIAKLQKSTFKNEAQTDLYIPEAEAV